MIDATPPPPISPWNLLSAREREVATMLALGATCAEIGSRLSISTKTVDTHRLRVLRKLELRSAVALARFAIRHGICDTVPGPYDARVA